MSSKRDRCLIAIAIQNPDSVDRLTVQKASAVVFREAKAEFGKGMVVTHYVRVRNYRFPVRFNGKNFQACLKQDDYNRLFPQQERH